VPVWAIHLLINLGFIAFLVFVAVYGRDSHTP